MPKNTKSIDKVATILGLLKNPQLIQRSVDQSFDHDVHQDGPSGNQSELMDILVQEEL
jgi:hypothetical protein